MVTPTLATCVQTVMYLGSTLTSARSLVLSHTMSTGIRQYFTVVEREECDLPSSKHSRHSRLNEDDHDGSDGSIIAAEEDINCLMNVLFQHNAFYHHSANPGQNLAATHCLCGTRRFKEGGITGTRLVSMWLYHLYVN